jgi:hypothetical protein
VRPATDDAAAPDRQSEDMPALLVNRALCTHSCLLADGRRVTLRHVVPSDAPRIAMVFGSRRDAVWGTDLVAFDDHGAVVGHAASRADVATAPAWGESGLDALLVHELRED